MTRRQLTPDEMQNLMESVRAAQEKAERDRILRVGDDGAARELTALLDGAAERVKAIGPTPAFLGECPHKYNDAWYDDLWYAVQAGETWWEQSHFFEGRSGENGEPEPLVEERIKFASPRTADAIKAAGASVESERIAALRSVLRDLQTAGWRTLTDKAFTAERGLAALVIERGQRWFVMETPNHFDADVFAWDDRGMFRVGGMGRIDQAVGTHLLLTFETIERDALSRLGEPARRYFRPSVADSDAVMRLAELLWETVQAVRATTDAPVAMRSRGSRTSPYAAFRPSDVMQPETHSAVLRPSEGEYRVPTNGKWPSYRPRGPRAQESEFTDEAKAFHLALGKLEDAGWRELFGTAYGEKLISGQTLALLVDPNTAVLVRDNAAVRVTPHGLEPLPPVPYPNLSKLDETFATLEARD